MATEDTRATLRGLLITDPRVRETSAIWTDESTITEAGPYIGVPAPTAATTASIAFAATGDLDASVDVDFQTVDGGSTGGVPVVYRRNGDSTWYGAENPARLTGVQSVDFASTIATEYRQPSMCDLGDGSFLIASRRATTLPARTIRVRRFDAEAGTLGSAVTVASDLTDPGNGESPRIISVREGGNVVAYLAYLHLGDDGICQVRIYRSTDKGTTWDIHVRGALGAVGISNYENRGYPVETWEPQSLEFAHWRGVFALFVHYNDQSSSDDYRDFTQQWVSRDSVAFDRLEYIEGNDSGDSRGFPRFIPKGDRFDLSYVMYDDATPSFYRVATTQRSLLSDCVSPAEGNAPTLSSYTAASDITAEGGMNLAGEYVTTRYIDRLGSGASETQGGEFGASFNGEQQGRGRVAEFTVITASTYPVVWPGYWWTSRDQTFYITDLAILPCAGSVWAAGRLTVPGDNTDGAMWLFRMGGFSDISLGLVGTEPSAGRGFYQTYIGVTRPDNVGWTRGVGGTPTETATATGWQMVTGVAESLQYTVTTTDTLENVTRFIVTDDSTGTTKGLAVMRVADGAVQVDVQIRSSATGFTVFDPNVPTVLATISTDMTVGVEVEVYMRHSGTQGRCSVYYRDHDSALQKSWTVAVESQTLTDAGSPGAAGLVGFAANASADVRYLAFHYGEDSGTSIPSGQTNPDDLRPLVLSTSPATLDAATAVQVIGGIAESGDTYRTSNEHTHAVENIVPAHEPSPARSWRSTDTTAHKIAYTLDAALDTQTGEDSAHFSDLLAFHVQGTNIRSGSLEVATAGATPSWASVYTIDNSVTLAYTRTGNVLVPNGGSGIYLRLNELAGAWVDLGSSKYRRIRTNTDGVWDSTFAGRKARVIFEDADGTEPATGTGYAVPEAFTVVLSNATDIAGVRLVIDSQSNPDGYHEIGNVVVGPVVVFGLNSSWGNVYESRPNTTVRTAIDGSRRVASLGPVRRMAELAWTDGVDLTTVDQASPDPDYISSTSTGGIGAAASVQDWPHQRVGLVELLDGEVHPVVYLPGIARGTPDARMLNRKHESVYGRIIGTGRVEVIIGEENASEVVRVPGMVIEGEV
jgi:hypothetical protein